MRKKKVLDFTLFGKLLTDIFEREKKNYQKRFPMILNFFKIMFSFHYFISAAHYGLVQGLSKYYVDYFFFQSKMKSLVPGCFVCQSFCWFVILYTSRIVYHLCCLPSFCLLFWVIYLLYLSTSFVCQSFCLPGIFPTNHFAYK